MYNLVNRANLVHSFSEYVYIFSLHVSRDYVPNMSPIMYGWLSGMKEHMLLYTRQSSIQNNKYQVSHKYNCFSWWWAHSRPKHVEKRNKHTKKNCTPSWFYLQDYTHTCSVGSVGVATERISVDTRFSARPDRPWDPPSLL